MQCTTYQRIGRVIANFGISFLTPLIGINVSNPLVGNDSSFTISIIQAFATAIIYSGLSFFRELRDWSDGKK